MLRPQIVLFATTLKDHIPEDHPVRLIDEIFDRPDWTGNSSMTQAMASRPFIQKSSAKCCRSR